MASILKVDNLDPQSGTALEFGTSGDTITVPSGATLDISASTLTPPATLPASSGVNLTALNATNLGSGTVPTARLGSGTASSSTILYGDQTYKAEPTGGKILQVVESKFTTNTTTSSTSYVATGHIGTITPSATGSKILVQLSIGNANVDDSNRNLWISLYRDIAGAGYSEIIGGGDPWFRVRAEASTNNATGGGTNSFIDSPSTTSACNYQIYFKTDIGTLYYQNSGDNYGLNNMILMEIGA